MFLLCRFKAAINSLNNTDENLVKKISTQVITSMINKKETVFTESESEQLRELLSFNVEELDIFISGCNYIFDQAAFYGLSPNALASQLQEHEMTETMVTVFGHVWAAYRAQLTSKLRNDTFGAPKVLSDIDWKLQLTISHQDLAKTKVCNSILNLELHDVTEKKYNNVVLELAKPQLLELYQKLETVQSQLDQIAN